MKKEKRKLTRKALDHTIRHYLFLLLFSCIFLGAQCKKGKNLDPDGLPKATQNGSMVFACKMNGENWEGVNDRNYVSGAVKGDTIAFGGSAAPLERLQIVIVKKNDQMTFKLSDSQNQYAQYISDKDCSNSKLNNGWSEKKATDGEVNFTKIDKDRKVISGTFWFTVPTDKCGTLQITDGRFDIRYNN